MTKMLKLVEMIKMIKMTKMAKMIIKDNSNKDKFVNHLMDNIFLVL